MDFLHSLPLLLKAAILGVVEGLTEFLPISSTGHLILAASLLGFTGEKAKLFEVAIQTGAMFAVIVYYRARIARVLIDLPRSDHRGPAARRFAFNVLIAFLPAAILGVIFGKKIKAVLFKPVPVALAFVIGALVILWVELRARRAKEPPRIDDVDALEWRDALKVGFAQAAALIPGTSRIGRDDHRRHAVRAVAQGRHRVLVLLGDPDLDRRRRLRHLQISRLTRHGRCTAVRRGPVHVVRVRAAVRALVDLRSSPRTTSCRSPGTASRSARSCSRPGQRTWSTGPIERARAGVGRR